MTLPGSGSRPLPLWVSFGVVLVGGVAVISYVVFPAAIYWMALPEQSGHRIPLGLAALLAFPLLHAAVALWLVWASSARHGPGVRSTTRCLAAANLALCLVGAVVAVLWWTTGGA